MGTKRGVVASRHRYIQVIPHFLMLDKTTDDHLVIDTNATGVFDTSLLVGLPSYYIELDCTLRTLPVQTNQGFFGNYNVNNNNDRLGISISDFGTGRMTVFHGGTGVFMNSALPLILGIRTIIRCEFTMLDVNTYEAKVYFNGVLQATQNVDAFTGGNMNEYAWIGASGSSATSPIIESTSDVDVHTFDYNGDFYDCNKGSGNKVKGTNNKEFDIITASIDPNYINNFMWQLEV